MAYLTECKQKRLDCLMCKNGKCIALNNTDLQNKICPFYKKKELNKDIK